MSPGKTFWGLVEIGEYAHEASPAWTRDAITCEARLMPPYAHMTPTRCAGHDVLLSYGSSLVDLLRVAELPRSARGACHGRPTVPSLTCSKSPGFQLPSNAGCWGP